MDAVAVNQNLENIPDPTFFSSIAPEQIRRLDLSFNNISTFAGLSNYHKINELILDNNSISDVGLLEQFPEIKLLSVNNNRITELESFLSAVERLMPSLSYLSCLGNPCCPDQLTDADNTEDDYRRYRYYVIYRLPNLRFLDSKPVSSKERREAQRHGPFLRRVRILPTASESSPPNQETTAFPYNPLPKTPGTVPESAAYRPCRYVYRGIHSEGNRFIRDNQL